MDVTVAVGIDVAAAVAADLEKKTFTFPGAAFSWMINVLKIICKLESWLNTTV